MTDNIVLRINLLESFDRMLERVAALGQAVRDDAHLPLWVARSEQELADNTGVRAKAIEIYRNLWYEDDQDGRGTLTCPGIIGASPACLDAARQCNAAKDAFKAAVLALKTLAGKQAKAVMADLHQRNDEVARAMRRMRAARLNLKQAYRHAPLLSQRPEKVGFTWSKQGRTIQRTSVAETRRLLERRAQTTEIRAALAKLARVPEDEILARIRPTVPHLRANIVFPLAGAEPERRLMQAPLPILIPLEAGQKLPEFVPVAVTPGAQKRLRRSDVRIEDEPFIALLRIHRYRRAYRGV